MSALSTLTISSLTSSTISATSTSITDGVNTQPPIFKLVGILLAVGSGLFIGTSFVFKKKGLLSAQRSSGAVAGEGHAYLKSPMWILGMTLMILGEILNFVAYAFTEAILVTPLGALSVVVCAILSSYFLKERLTFFGKIGCVLCIIGAVTIALNGPQTQSTSTILEFQALFLAPGFLAFGSVIILTSLGLIFFVAPKYGKTNMLVYITICSLIGGLSVACTQGLGSSILTSIRGDNQFKHWFMYFLLGFVILTLLTEINYLNKALELFNTSMVTPTYYVMFTGSTLITSVILYQGFKAPVVDILTVVMGFLVIVCGITLLQLSKVDPEEIKGKLDRRSTILLSAARSEIYRDSDSEKGIGLGAEDPGMDALRGSFGAFGSVHRAMSARRSMRREGRFDPTDVLRRRNMGSPEEETGRDGVKRYQLEDRAMLSPDLPADAADKISLYSNSQPPSQSTSRDRSASIQFATADNVHLYADQPGSGSTFHIRKDITDGDHFHAGAVGPKSPLSADISTSNTGFEIPTPRLGQMYIDPYLANQGYGSNHSSGHNSRLDFNSDVINSNSRENKVQDELITPTSTRSRFNLPTFGNNSNASDRGSASSRDRHHHRGVQHPKGPLELDQQESMRLVDDAGDDEGDYNGNEENRDRL